MSTREIITDLLSHNSGAKATKPSPVKGKRKAGCGEQEKLAACIESVLTGIEGGMCTQ